MEQSSLDTDIDNYSVSDILDLLELDTSSSVMERNDAVDNIITDLQSKNKPDLVNFFTKAKTKMFAIEEGGESEVEAESEVESEAESEVESEAESEMGAESEVGAESEAGSEAESKENVMLSGKDRWELPAPSWYLNPAATRTITQDMSVDTRFRPEYYSTLSTNFTVDLPEPQKKVISMRISAIEMPMTYYSISNSLGNNTMLVISDSAPDTSKEYYSDINGAATVDFSPTNLAWLVIMADGNYDTISWMNATSRAKAETAVNEALSLAIPGAIDELGRFYKFSSPITIDYLNTDFEASSVNSLPERQDIRFSMNRINGKSAFGTPQPTDIIAGNAGEYITSTTNSKQISTLRFNVDVAGNLDTDTNIQMKLGWTLGFRAAQYVMGAVSPVTSSTPISAVSEGTGFITGPRYAFLSVEDYLNSARPSFIVAYGTHTKANNIITRINLGGGGYHNLATRDAGLTGHTNRTREYFGPVDIQRLTIKLQDEYGRVIDINNMDWSFTVTFKKLYN
jgi:hypothetical protein